LYAPKSFVTAVAFAEFPSGIALHHLFGLGYSVGAPNNIYGWGLTANNGNWQFTVTQGGLATITTITTSGVSGETRVVAGTYDGANIRIYLDGLQKNSAALTGVLDTNTSSVTVGQNRNAGGAGWISPVYLGYAWSRALTASELLELAQEPYAFITPQSPRAQWFIPAAAATPTLGLQTPIIHQPPILIQTW
jgi:hypothetical protein